jgi:CheY-like chemotaxis protein
MPQPPGRSAADICDTIPRLQCRGSSLGQCGCSGFLEVVVVAESRNQSPVRELAAGSWLSGRDDEGAEPDGLKRTREIDLPATLARNPIVLVLDDDWDTCEAFKEVLEQAGFNTVCVSNGELGLQHLRDYPETAVVILDLMMPAMNGWTFFERVRAMPHLAEVPILVVTGTAPHWGYPTTNVLRKPVGGNELVAAVRTAISRRGRATAIR